MKNVWKTFYGTVYEKINQNNLVMFSPVNSIKLSKLNTFSCSCMPCDGWKIVLKISLTFFKTLKFSMTKVFNLFSNVFLLSDLAFYSSLWEHGNTKVEPRQRSIHNPVKYLGWSFSQNSYRLKVIKYLRNNHNLRCFKSSEYTSAHSNFHLSQVESLLSIN